MTETRDHAAASAFVSRCLRDLAFKGTAEDAHARELARLAFLQGWHEAMVARDTDDETVTAPEAPS